MNAHHMLIQQARRLTTAANVHRAKELISAFEMALRLHDRGSQSIDLARCERELRQFVAGELNQDFRTA